MSMKSCAAAAALLLLLGLSSFAQEVQQKSPVPAPAAAPAAEEALPSCADCHDEAKVFALNPHARGATLTKGQVSNNVCTPCHGDGTEHIQAGGDKTKIMKP